MHRQGQILKYKDFEFPNGSRLDKLFVVLNTATTNHPCLVLITTSNRSRYPYAIPGCNSLKNCFYVLVECDQDFDTDTYIQLPRIFDLDIDALLSKKQLSFIGHMSDVCFNNLKRCLRKYKHDIPTQYWAKIYRPT